MRAQKAIAVATIGAVAAALTLVFAAASSSAPAPWHAKREVAQRGNVRAELSYQTGRVQGLFRVRAVRLRIFVSAALRRDDRLTASCSLCAAQPLGAAGFGQKSLAIRDLDGDRRLDVAADFYTGGAHCCFYSLIYGYEPAANRFARTRHNWGDPGYRFVDYDRDGVPELRSGDDRFAYAFTCYACSPLPLQIWRYRGGSLVDVTRTFPAQVRRDAGSLWASYLRERPRANGDVRGILAAYLADKYVLGKQADGWRRLRQANARGDLHPADACFSFTPCDGRYLAKLSRFLKRTGYAR